MANGWGPLAGVCMLLLFLAGSWPRHESRIASTAQTLIDPATARYDNFNPVDAKLKHGARTPLNTIYNFDGVNWTHCRDHYQTHAYSPSSRARGVEVELHDENGHPQPPPILDANTPVLPGGCRQGTLTEAGYRMAVDVGTWLRNRYVTSAGSDATGGFLPDMEPRGWDPEVATLRTTPIRRTIATLRGVLTGLWPRLAPSNQQQQQRRRTLATATAVTGVEASLPVLPVLPVGASLEPLEIMYGSNNTCARLGPLHEAMQRDLDAADARNTELPRLNQLVAEALGLDTNTSILWPKLYDHLAAMIADGAPLPPGASREVLDIVWAQAERHEASIIAPSADLCAAMGPGGDGGGGGGGAGGSSSSARRRRCREELRLGIGMLVQRLLQNMDASVAQAELPSSSSPSPSRLYLFSGHDSSVMPLLAVLGQPARAWPPFASHLVFELWQAASRQQLRTAALGRRGVLAAEAGPGAQSSSSLPLSYSSSYSSSGSDYWVRVLYNGAPLVVPRLSNTDGWIPLGLLRKHVLLPYAIGPAEHTAACSRVDISDLYDDSDDSDPRAPSLSSIKVGGGGGKRSTAARARERLSRHATL
ncbi:hypothetical protein VOLCADRAFT_96118 [Volvox carteri f. nagariensis]|uniref:Acid phosphatase n=1 Tax=Volvox carteri f. nagariensis TaxID=3068 RepID=D8U994_VOLCA|nr:uncharacterized protein VOLCADRAFT_96118 [Volvox carteri f. nagariensis]EFJ43767.1 hypothetical protein VOLCADRAFT_96118 [Volvox carteri f. nagariensis]|eukprot:XP_002955248.1 hypothetical protein VOLCADRAFT_96118 [Volvox carteri f. nagariensis]